MKAGPPGASSARPPTVRLTIGWLIVFALGVATAVPVGLGLRRDTRAGEVTIPISLGVTSGTHARSFRVWNAGTYNLFISTVNFDQARVGSRFRGEVRVVIRRHDGETLLDQRFGPAAFAHAMPYNYGDTKLVSLAMDNARIRPLTFAVEVTRADPVFAGVRSEVKLWRERADAGMGGMVTYVLILPAIMFLLLSDFLSFVLLQRGRPAPFVISLGATGVFLLAVWFR